MKKSLLMTALFILAIASFSVADDGVVTVGLSFGESHEITHDDSSPFKGLLTVNATNTGTEPWGAFVFQIFDPTGMGQYTDVYFTVGDGSYPQINGVSVEAADVVIETTVDGYSKLTVYFPEMSVGAGESVTIDVYTDNTASQHSFFGVMMWPVSLEVGTQETSLSSVKALFQ